MGEYAFIEYNLCPDELNLGIENKKKYMSISNNDDNFNYKYNGECLNQCPENTVGDSSNICLDNNLDKCVLIIKSTNIKGSNISVDMD